VENIQTDLLGREGSDPATATQDGNLWDTQGVDPSKKLSQLPIQGTVGHHTSDPLGRGAQAPRPHRMVTCGMQRASTRHE